MLCRDPVRGAEARDSVARECGEEARVHLAVVDVSSLASIRSFARNFPTERADVLVHNAGVLPRERQLVDGVELTFATNVLGPFALTGLLMDRLSRSSDARIIFVASGGLYLQRLDLSLLDVDASHFDGTRAYANAKRAQVILAHVLAEGFSENGLITFARMHPGWADTTAVRTSLPRFHSVMRHFLRSPEQAADTIIWLAASDRAKGTRGDLWFDRRVAPEYPVPFTRGAVETGRAYGSGIDRSSEMTAVSIRKVHAAVAPHSG